MTNTTYFLPNEIEGDLHVKKLSNGDWDYVEALYSNESISPSADGTKDPLKLIKANFPQEWFYENYTEQVKMLVQEGDRLPFSIDTNTGARMCFGSADSGGCYNSYDVKVRGMASKIPGWPFFTGYQSA